MFRTWFGLGLLVVASLALSMTGVSADGKLGSAAELKPNACGDGRLIINVEQKVINDADSGVAGNAWATDNYERHIKVWQTAPGTFCAILTYEGKFTTLAGTSPSGADTLIAGIKGEFKGGYRSTAFTAVLAPTRPTHGNIGTFDYQCDTSFTCPGYVNWRDLYFTGVSGFDLAWWGWSYHADGHGTWINAIGGNSGDITG